MAQIRCFVGRLFLAADRYAKAKVGGLILSLASIVTDAERCGAGWPAAGLKADGKDGDLSLVGCLARCQKAAT
jgi:hypothetical protein